MYLLYRPLINVIFIFDQKHAIIILCKTIRLASKFPACLLKQASGKINHLLFKLFLLFNILPSILKVTMDNLENILTVMCTKPVVFVLSTNETPLPSLQTLYF